MRRPLDLRMNDGSRHFGVLPFSRPWTIVRDHVGLLDGARLTEFLTDGVTEAQIGFELAGQQFTLNIQFDEYWFSVADPSCPEPLLRLVLAHFARILDDAWLRASAAPQLRGVWRLVGAVLAVRGR